jgi:hypothetical protein
MRPHRGVLSPLTSYLHLVGLCAALGTVSPSLAQSQESVSPERMRTGPHAAGVEAQSCVDPADAAARGRFQDEPCRLPKVRLPHTQASNAGALPRWPSAATESPAKGHGHAMFWRFPVQGRGPHEVPRHSWR